MKATVLAESSLYFIFSPSSLCSSDVCRHESGRCHTFPFFLTIFYHFPFPGFPFMNLVELHCGSQVYNIAWVNFKCLPGTHCSTPLHLCSYFECRSLQRLDKRRSALSFFLTDLTQEVGGLVNLISANYITTFCKTKN